MKTWWSATSDEISTKRTPEAELLKLEARYRISIPTDFRYYLSECVPAETNWDGNDGNWWPLEDIKNIPEEYQQEVSQPIAHNADKHLFFLDYSVWCWAWAISCTGDESRGKVAIIYGQGRDRYVAESFSEFVEKYTTNWYSIL